jgi:hypothetical protein
MAYEGEGFIQEERSVCRLRRVFGGLSDLSGDFVGTTALRKMGHQVTVVPPMPRNSMKKKIIVAGSLSSAVFVVLMSSSAPTRAQVEKKTCESESPKHLKSVPSDYSYDSQTDAFRAMERELEEVRLQEEPKYSAGSGPCGPNGWQVKIRANWKKSGDDAGRPGSLMGCPTCEDTSSGPKTYEKWRVSYDD